MNNKVSNKECFDLHSLIDMYIDPDLKNISELDEKFKILLALITIAFRTFLAGQFKDEKSIMNAELLIQRIRQATELLCNILDDNASKEFSQGFNTGLNLMVSILDIFADTLLNNISDDSDSCNSESSHE